AKKTLSPVNGRQGLSLFTALSVWEIAHRWHGVDPNTTDPNNLPLRVQDTLRTLSLALLTQEIPASDPSGLDFGLRSDGPRYDHWLAHASPMERARGYEAVIADHTREHHEAVAGLEVCTEQRRYDRAKLDSVFISMMGIQRFCEQEYVPLPEFWFPGGEVKSDPPLRAEQLDKAACQGIARTLWDSDPTLTIQALSTHPAIQRHGNGAHYKEKTLRKWLSEVDPRSLEAKTGRPKGS
ncbi:MAG: hypothetical protein ACRESO_10630, partial [Gammaproteobacteria bacterium]